MRSRRCCSGCAVSARADPAASRSCELSRAGRTHTPSSRCLSCHDGTAAPGLGESHPVDVDYARASLRDPGRWAPAIAKLGAYVMALFALLVLKLRHGQAHVRAPHRL